MGKVLRILIVVILVFGVAALFLEFQLKGKREALVGRAHKFEESVKRIARTIEAQPAAEAPALSLPERDISEVSARELENPETTTFWSAYPFKLEQDNLPTMNYDTDALAIQLRQYYQLDEMGKKIPDPRNPRLAATSGAGTMQEALDTLFDRAKAQNALLNTTRGELRKVREELVDVINEHNRLKRSGRIDKKTIEDLNTMVARLEQEKAALDSKINILETEKVDLEAEVAEKTAEIARQKEISDGHEVMIANLQKQLEWEREKAFRPPGTGIAGATRVPDNLENELSPGDKGKIVAFDDHLKFVVVEFTPEFMIELLGEDLSKGLPQIEMMVRRPGLETPAGDFVTRIRLRQVVRDQGLVVADVLIDWQQSPLEKDDVVYF